MHSFIHSFIHLFIRSFNQSITQPIVHSLIRWLDGSLILLRYILSYWFNVTHCFMDWLTHCFIDSLIHWFIGSCFFIESLIGWLTASFIHWFTDSLFRWFLIYRLIPWLLGPLIHSLSCAWILSCHVSGISTTICSFVDGLHNFNTSLLLHLQNFPVEHFLPI